MVGPLHEHMKIGTIKWYCSEFGLGFIRPDIIGHEVFINLKNISNRDELADLSVGQVVSYATVDGIKGPLATYVIKRNISGLGRRRLNLR